MVPLLTSLVVALGGLYLGWLVYRNVKAGAADPLEQAAGRRVRLLKNKYYFDEFYQTASSFARRTGWPRSSRTSGSIAEIIDGILHGIATRRLVAG